MEVVEIEIEISDTLVFSAAVDLIKFKKILGSEWNLEKAVKNSTTILFNITPSIIEDNILDLVWLNLDWGKLIDTFSDSNDSVMKVNGYLVNYKDWIRFKPGFVKTSRKFIIDVEEKKDGSEVILIQSLRPYPTFSIKNFIDTFQFTYGSNKWGFGVENITSK